MTQLEIKEALNVAQAEIRACYKRLGIQGSNALTMVDCAYESILDIDPIFERINKFCSCKPELKTGSTSAMHCNICGKIEQTETWLK